MRKRLKARLFLLAFLLAPVCLPAQDDFNSFAEGIFEPQEPQELEIPERKIFRFKNRMVELSIANINFDFSNDFIAASDLLRNPFYMLRNIKDIIEEPVLIWHDPPVINLDHFFDGFQFGFGASIKPFSFNFNWKDEWGFGLDIAHIDVTGNLSLSGNLVTISEAKEDKFGVGAAVFVEAGVPVFFHYGDFKIKLRPAAYVPVVYTEPKITYSFTNVVKEEGIEGTRFDLKYDMKVYSLVSVEGADEDIGVVTQNLLDTLRDIPNSLGYDFRLNVEYPWRYDIDIGVDVVNIPVPFAAARLNHYIHLEGSAWADLSELDIVDLIGKDEEGNAKKFEDLRGKVFDYPDNFAPEYKIDIDGKKIYRPFAMVFYAHYRPYETQFLTLIPSFGFSINYLYPRIGAVEGGLSARFDTANIFITTLGINYNDRKWINSLDFVLNLRAFEFDLGISFQSQNFARSWQGAGLGVNLGLKFGY